MKVTLNELFLLKDYTNMLWKLRILVDYHLFTESNLDLIQ